ncbi:MAG: hypothetical protein LBW85_09600 [Deltaproteobacteria bacterium]|jgi:hypothetical protein|nr:hypothetical protein [Deltaproteobacteria bacterium]
MTAVLKFREGPAGTGPLTRILEPGAAAALFLKGLPEAWPESLRGEIEAFGALAAADALEAVLGVRTIRLDRKPGQEAIGAVRAEYACLGGLMGRGRLRALLADHGLRPGLRWGRLYRSAAFEARPAAGGWEARCALFRFGMDSPRWIPMGIFGTRAEAEAAIGF